MKKTINKKVLSSLIGLFLVGTLFGAAIVYGQTPTTTFVISAGVYPGAPSYTIWIDTGVFYAKNSHGTIEISSTNATTVFSYCSDELTSGGLITVMPGIYPIDYGVQVPTHNFGTGWEIENQKITVEGFGESTILRPNQALSRIITVEAMNVVIRNLCLDGWSLNTEQSPNAADGLIVFDNAAHGGILEKCVLRNGLNADGAGTYQLQGASFRDNLVYNNEHGLVLTATLNSSVTGNKIFLSYTNGILLHEEYTNHNVIANNIIEGAANNGIEVSDLAHYNVIEGNTVLTSLKGIAILTAYNVLSGNLVKGNTEEGLYLGSGATDNIVTGSTFTVNNVGIQEFTGAAGNLITSNIAKANTANGIITLNTSSPVHLCFNNTDWIA